MESERRATTRAGHASSLALNAVKLVVMLACLAFFLSGLATTYAYVMFAREDTAADFEDGTFYFTGLNSGDDTVRLLPIGLTGQWVEDAPLPEVRSDLAAVALDGRIFAFGGYSETTGSEADRYRTEIYSSTVSSNGSLGQWQKVGNLPVGLRGHRVVVTRTTALTSTAYVIGGDRYDSEHSVVSTDDVYRVIIDNATGAVSSIVTQTGVLPDLVAYHSAVIHEDKIYVIGGMVHDAGQVGVVVARVYYLPILPVGDGSLGNGVLTALLPEPLRSAGAVLHHGVISDTIYVLGGSSTDGSNAQPDVAVLHGDIDPGTGNIAAWHVSGDGNLLVPVNDHAAVMVNSGELFVIGGRAGTAGNLQISTTVKSALADESDPARIYNWCGEGPCDRWQGETGESLLEARANLAAVYYQSHIYVLGGTDANQDSQQTVYRGSISGNPRYRYAPSGYYMSNQIDLGEQARSQVRGIAWRAFMSDTQLMTVTMYYRFWDSGGTAPTTWSEATPNEVYTDDLSSSYIYTASISSVFAETRYFQYKADMRSITNTMSPHLDWIDVYYDVPDPDIAATKSGPAGVYPGGIVTFTIGYSVTGGVPALDAVLTETLPANTSYVGSGWSSAGGNVYTYFLGTVGVTGTQESVGEVPFTVQVDADPENVDAITNVVRSGFPAMIDSWGNPVVDPAPSNNAMTLTLPLWDVSWDLGKHLAPTSTVSLSGGAPVVTYTLLYTYTGGHTETSPVLLTDTVNLSFFSAITPFGGTRDGNTITWSVSPMGLGQAGVVSFTAQLTRPLNNGAKFVNVAHISSLHAPVATSNPVTLTVISTPTLSITKTASIPSGTAVLPGTTLAYTIEVRNTGTMNATGGVITDVLDPNLTDLAVYSDGVASDGVLTWNKSPLVVDTPWVVTFTARVSDTSDVTITNQGSIDCDQFPPLASQVLTHPVPSAPVLAITKDDGYVRVAPGQILTYSISYANIGVQPAVGVRVTETVPSEVIALANAGWQNCGATCRYYEVPDPVPPFTGTGTLTFSVQVRAEAPLSRPFTNTVRVGGQSPALPASANDVDIVYLAPKLKAVGKTDGRDLVGRGEILTYTVTYQNSGQVSTSNGIRLTDTLPAGVVYVGGTPAWSPTGGGQYVAVLPDLAPSLTATARIVLRVADAAPEGPLTNTVVLFTPEEVDLSDNWAFDVDTVAAPHLSIGKTDGRSTVNPGEYLTYTVRVTNTGPIANNLTLTDTLPSGVRYVGYGWGEAGGGLYTRSVPSLASGGSITLTLIAQVNAGTPSGTITNRAQVFERYAVYPASNVAIDNTQVNPVRDLAVTVRDGVSGVHPGQLVTYTITYTNEGNVAFDNVLITSTLQGGLVKVGQSCATQPAGQDTYVISVGTVAPGQKGDCRIRSQVKPGMVTPRYVTYTTRIGGAQADQDSDDNASTDHNYVTTTPPTEFGDLYAVSVAPTIVTPTVGVATNFAVTVTNVGRADARDVTRLGLKEEEIVGTFRLPPPLPAERFGTQSVFACADYDWMVYIALYLDPLRSPEGPGDGWWNYVAYLPISPAIPVGQSRVVSNTWHLGGAAYGPLQHRFEASGQHRAAAQADVYFDMGATDPLDYCGWRPSYGHLPESSELNNIAASQFIVQAAPEGGVDDRTRYLPFIGKAAQR